LKIRKEIPGYEGLYSITTDGKVWSYEREHNLGGIKAGRWLKVGSNGKYKTVQLHKDGKRNQKYVHRLIAETFIPNPENKPTVDHIDRHISNNFISNLTWATYKEQADNKNREDFATYGFKGKNHTDETKKRISKSHLNRRK
jgi:hypothetical protein